ncbi:MAG: hypothetical protein WD894_03460 [Pirellulales bacterium]
MVPVLTAEANNFIKLGIIRKDPKRLFGAGKGAKRFKLAAQLGYLPSKIVDFLFQLLEGHIRILMLK